jgi:hypothetical protein
MVVGKKLHTVEEFDEFIARPENRDRLFELLRGEIVEKVPTQQPGLIALKLGARVLMHAKQPPVVLPCRFR